MRNRCGHCHDGRLVMGALTPQQISMAPLLYRLACALVFAIILSYDVQIKPAGVIVLLGKLHLMGTITLHHHSRSQCPF